MCKSKYITTSVVKELYIKFSKFSVTPKFLCFNLPNTNSADARFIRERLLRSALTLFIPGGGAESAPPPLTFFSITFEVFIVTPSNFVTFPNFYLSLLWEKKFLENMPQCCLGNHFWSVTKYFF